MAIELALGSGSKKILRVATLDEVLKFNAMRNGNFHDVRAELLNLGYKVRGIPHFMCYIPDYTDEKRSYYAIIAQHQYSPNVWKNGKDNAPELRPLIEGIAKYFERQAPYLLITNKLGKTAVEEAAASEGFRIRHLPIEAVALGDEDVVVSTGLEPAIGAYD